MFKLEKPDTEKKDTEKFGEKFGEKTKELMSKIGKRNLVIGLSVLALGGAVWLNIALFSEGAKRATAGALDTDAQAVNADVDTTEVNAGESPDAIESYFAATKVELDRSRGEALEVLQMVADGDKTESESRTAALAEISQIALDIDNEGKIESLVSAKGFDKCLAVISDGKCNVIVSTNASLLPNEVAQIQEIVYEQSGILPSQVKIIEKIPV